MVCLMPQDWSLGSSKGLGVLHALLGISKPQSLIEVIESNSITSSSSITKVYINVCYTCAIMNKPPSCFVLMSCHHLFSPPPHPGHQNTSTQGDKPGSEIPSIQTVLHV